MIDDGSLDDSSKICNEYCKKDNRFKYFKKDNGGQADARNFGLEHCNGEFVTFVDQDDVIHSRMYEVLVNDVENNQADVSACFAKYESRSIDIVMDELSIDVDPDDINLELFHNSDEALMALSRNNDNMLKVVWNKIYSRKVLDNLRFDKDAGIADDCKFTMLLFAKDFKTTYRHIILYYWMQHNTNQSKSNNFKNKYKAVLTYYDMIKLFNKNNDVVKGVYKDYINLIMWTYSALKRSKNHQELDLEHDLITRLKKTKQYKHVLDFKHKIMYTLLTHFRFIYNILLKIGM